VTGRIALHGGGEFLPGDEQFLRAILMTSGAGAGAGAAMVSDPGSLPDDPGPSHAPIRVCIVPTAAARGRPELAAAKGASALRSVASQLGSDLLVDTVMIVDAASAADRQTIGPVGSADLVYLPGGDPDLIPTVLAGSAGWAAIRSAWERGATIAGASAGAMALTDITWTPDGLIPGLGLVPGVLVLPHARASTWAERVAAWSAGSIDGIGILGLAERTGLVGRPGEPWQVVGPGEVRWLPPGTEVATGTIVRTARDQIILTTRSS
jgi:cyanophycinase